MWSRKVIWTDEGRVRGCANRRIERVTDPAGNVEFDLVLLWDGVPVKRTTTRKQPTAPNRWGKFIK